MVAGRFESRDLLPPDLAKSADAWRLVRDAEDPERQLLGFANGRDWGAEGWL